MNQPSASGAFAHAFAFDPAYGYDRERLLAIGVPPEPADFADFWTATAAEAATVPLRLEQRPLAIGGPELEASEIRFDAWGGQRIGAWLVRPRGRAPRYGLVVGHGYGGRSVCPLGGPQEHAALYPCAPGFHLSARSDLPGDSDRHVVHGIASRETYLIRACVASLWAAASALLALCPEADGRLGYSGGSFGGGLGALALPWDRRFRLAQLVVPTFGHHPLRVQSPCVGSGESVRRWRAAHPEVDQVLPYFDAAIAARRVGIPTLVAPALFDPAVPPPGQFAVANALPDKQLHILSAGHFAYPAQAAEDRALAAATDAWFAGLSRETADRG
jgi:cephalosporin-C deacetylase